MVDTQVAAAVFVLCIGWAERTARKVFRYVKFELGLSSCYSISATLEVRYMLPPLA